MASATKAGIPIFAVAEGDALQDGTAADLLRDLADATGGRMYKANHSKQIGTVFQAIGRYLQNGYLLAFQAPSEAKTTSWHELQVQVKHTPEPLKVTAGSSSRGRQRPSERSKRRKRTKEQAMRSSGPQS